MSTDISNTFLHDVIDNRIRDLSNNPRAQFLGMLVNMLNENSLNSNLAMLPLANNFVTTQISQGATLNRILNDSLLDKTPYKKILSDKGNEQLKTVKYSKEKFEQESCCIMFYDFEEGQDVIQLPCKHIFDPEGIKTWLNEEQAKHLVENGCMAVAEGANMPCTPEAIALFQSRRVLFSPGKASNAGGVATSGLEMSQNSLRFNWTSEEVDQKLHNIMLDIHKQCVNFGTQEDGYIDYVKGANIAGFVKVADAMIDQGIV